LPETRADDRPPEHMLGVLNTHHARGAATNAFNVQGETDILIRHAGRNLFIFKCKFSEGRRPSLRRSTSCSAAPAGAT
jgi:hypothetical protein